MKIPNCQPGIGSVRALLAFTLNELMITLSIIMVVLTGILYAHLTGVRMFQITRAKLGASDEARSAINLLIDEIRTAKLVKIGSGSLSTFTEVGVDTTQNGSAVQVYKTTDTNKFVRYFWDSSDRRLKRTTNGSSAVSIVANSVTNQLIFTAENYLGQPLTNNQNNRVIALTLQFYQIQYPVVKIGPGEYYDFYQLRTKITRRALE
jgi:type II secretory pathway pseudopilin PulG